MTQSIYFIYDFIIFILFYAMSGVLVISWPLRWWWWQFDSAWVPDLLRTFDGTLQGGKTFDRKNGRFVSQTLSDLLGTKVLNSGKISWTLKNMAKTYQNWQVWSKMLFVGPCMSFCFKFRGLLQPPDQASMLVKIANEQQLGLRNDATCSFEVEPCYRIGSIMFDLCLALENLIYPLLLLKWYYMPFQHVSRGPPTDKHRKSSTCPIGINGTQLLGKPGNFNLEALRF